MIAAATPPVLVAEASPAASPPLGREIAFLMTDEQRGARGPVRFSTELRARFDRSPDGGLTLTLTTVPRAGGGALFGSMMDAFAAIPLRYRLDSRGRLVDVLDLDGSWAAASAAVSSGVSRATGGRATTAARALQAYRDSFAAMPEALRREALLANARAVLGSVERSPPPGTTRPWTGEAADMAGRPIALTGTLTRSADGGASVRFHLEARGGGISETADTELSRADGLLLSSRRTLARAGGAPFFTETVERLPRYLDTILHRRGKA